MNENTTKTKRSIKDTIIRLMLWAALVGSFIFAITSMIKAIPIGIRKYGIMTNEKYAIYEQARKAEENEYESFKTRKVTLETKSDKLNGSFTTDISLPVGSLPKIEVNGISMTLAQHLTDIVMKALPEKIADAVIKHYTIRFFTKPIRQEGNIWVAGRHAATTREIEIVFDGTNWQEAASTLTHEIGHMVFGQTLETFLDAGYIKSSDLTPVNFHNDCDSYSLIYDEYMAQAFAEYVWYSENLRLSDEKFYQTMDKAVKSFSFDIFCFM